MDSPIDAFDPPIAVLAPAVQTIPAVFDSPHSGRAYPDTLLAKLPASPLHKMPASDIRDWTAIRTWASNLVTQLQPALSQ